MNCSISVLARWFWRLMRSSRWRARSSLTLYLAYIVLISSTTIIIINILSGTKTYPKHQLVQMDHDEDLYKLMNVKQISRNSLSNLDSKQKQYWEELHSIWNISLLRPKSDTNSKNLNYSNLGLCKVPYTHQKVCTFRLKAHSRKNNNNLAIYQGEFMLQGQFAFRWTGSDEERFYMLRINRTNCKMIEFHRFGMPEKPQHNITQYIMEVPKGDVLVGVTWGKTDPHVMWNEFSLHYTTMRTVHKRGIVTFSGIHGYPGFSQYNISNTGLILEIERTLTFGEDFKIMMDSMPYSVILQRHPDLDSGGHWKPPNCVPHSNIAIIVPYRSREHHLKVFIDNMMRFLKLQNVEFTFFIIEQAEPELFNRAALMNVGYLETKKYNFDCYIFHDVDQLPEDLSNFYYCADQPRHLVVTRSVTHYFLKRDYFFGGGIMMRAEHIEKINGFPNRMFGWGGEDDDIWARIQLLGMEIYRYPKEIARYTSLDHSMDDGNPKQERRLETIHHHAKFYERDGLTTIQYSVLAREIRHLFHHIIVRIPGPSTADDIDSYIPYWAMNETKKYRDINEAKQNGFYVPEGRNFNREGEIS